MIGFGLRLGIGDVVRTRPAMRACALGVKLNVSHYGVKSACVLLGYAILDFEDKRSATPGKMRFSEPSCLHNSLVKASFRGSLLIRRQSRSYWLVPWRRP
ncbi:hypothetical protein ABIA40_000330 [Bradyrhizobium sp. USDA 223]